jgi:GH25 family lysozyme M1 (1,4-beta-N-acetylmuramidase)
MGSTIPRDITTTSQPKIRSLAVQPLAVGQPAGTPGLDVSGYQTLTRSDWNTVYANGARFAYVKATESTDYVSSQFAEQYNDSSAAGLVRGAYHFATPNTSSGATQANYFVSNGGGWSADGKTLPPMLDIEYNPYGDTCYGMAGAAMVSWIRDFSNTVLARTGRLPAIYSTTDWWTRCTGNSSAFSANPLFIARYTTSGSVGTLPAGWSTYTFWQWWDAGYFPGDQDVFNGNISQLITTASTQNAWRPSPVITAGDLNSDRKPDLLATKPDGSLWYYSGTGTGGVSGGGTQVGSGWNMFSQVVGAGDLNGDGKPDILGVTPSGDLYFYAGTGTTGSGSNPSGLIGGVRVGTGWNMFSQIIAGNDLNGDGKSDILGVTPSGDLHFYPGTGTTGRATNGNSSDLSGLGSGALIGYGWNMYTQLVSPGDLNGDHKPDILGVTPQGTMNFYAGTGTTGSATNSSGVVGGGVIGSGWNAFG